MLDNSNTRKLWWIITQTTQLDPMILIDMVELRPQLVLQQMLTGTLNNMTPTVRGLDFLAVQGIMGLSLEVHIPEAVFMIQARGITNTSMDEISG